MKKSILFSLLAIFVFSISTVQAQVKNSDKNIAAIKRQVTRTVHNWHKAASKANFEDYFELMTKDAVFIGTDPSENWTRSEFEEFAKPYFDAGKAWSFSAIDRNIYVHENYGIAWFDELLKTQMGICRGSGILSKEDGKWKIHHYVLSITIPNEDVDKVTEMKSAFDEKFISDKLKN